MRILADTNVIIDALTSREPWNKSAEEIFLMAANHTIEMYITASSATDIYYLIRKHLHNIEASRKDMDYIVTRNIKDYQAGGTKIILPDDFVKLVEEE